MNEDKFIQVNNLEKTYENGYQAIKSVSFSVKKGDLVCLLGPSGCGKTTTLNMIAGLLNPTGGDIIVNGKSLLNVAPKDRNIGYVFQNYALYPHMTVLQNVMFPMTVGKNKKPKDEAERIAKKFMKLTHIEELADQKPGNLSGGQQQRVSIARALVQEPQILLMDEPLSNLDARLRLKIREEIRNLVKEVGITTLFVTHDQEEALSIGDKIILFHNGVIQQDDKGQDLYLEPNDQIVGSDFEIPVAKLNSSKFRSELTDGDYTLSIRPENLKLADEGELSEVIDDIELIGRERVLKFNHAGISQRALIDLEQEVKRGDKVKFKMNLDRIYLFKPDGERIY